MANAPVSFISQQYEDFENYWLKCYEQGTVNPITMFDDAAGTTAFAKLEVNIDGFFESTGGAIIIPHVNETYDAWLFPTEAEADANDTINATQIADNITASDTGAIATATQNEDTTATMTANTSYSSADVGITVIDTKEFSTGNGGSRTYDVVLTSSVTPNAFEIIIGVADASISFVARKVEDVQYEKTLALMIASSIYQDGESVRIGGRISEGDGGGAVYRVVLASSVTTNVFNTVQGTTNTAIAFDLIIPGTLTLRVWGAAGVVGTDDLLAIQDVINFARDNARSLTWEDGTYEISASLKSQHDSSFKENHWIFEDAIIAPTFSGSPTLIIEGGAFFQHIESGPNILPVAAQRMVPTTFTNRDTASIGMEVRSTRIKQSGKWPTFSSLRGDAINTITAAGGNSNTSVYKAYIEICSRGMVCSGTDDNLSVVKLDLNVTACAGPGFDGEAGCPIRQWDAWVRSENNCIIDTAKAGFQVDNATKGTWKIYSEQQNVSNEIEFNNTSIQNTIFSYRSNKDVIVDNNIVTGGNGLHSKAAIQTVTPVIEGSSGAGVGTYTTQTFTFQQIGNVITFQLNIIWTATTGTGNLRVGGLPEFPTGLNAVTFSEFIVAGIGATEVVLGAIDSSRKLKLFKAVPGSAASFVPIQATGTIQCSGTYFIQ